jgi:hypothetical protein
MNKITVSCTLLVFIIIFSLVIDAYLNNIESFEIKNAELKDGKYVVPQGFYQIHPGKITVIPYGYQIDPTDNTKINPITVVQKYSSINDIQTQIDDTTKAIADMDKAERAGTATNPTKRTQLNYKLETLNLALRNFNEPENAANTGPAYDAPNYISSSRDAQGKLIFTDVQYHDSVDTINGQKDAYGLSPNVSFVYDKSGNKVAFDIDKDNPILQGNITYYQPGTYKYGASTYVPNYEDSVYLSRSTGISQVMPLKGTASMLGGMCTHNKNDPMKLEEACNATNLNQCGSMSCCVLLGGSKCVSGNEKGPLNKTNYADVYVKNRDYYYYQGNCYGNCPNP